MILGALLQVNLATKNERKNFFSTKKTNAVAISFDYQSQQLEKSLYFYPLGFNALLPYKEFVLF